MKTPFEDSKKDRDDRTNKPALVLRKPRKLNANEALKELVSKKKVLPACESSSACSRFKG